jgi:hypothetical protein
MHPALLGLSMLLVLDYYLIFCSAQRWGRTLLLVVAFVILASSDEYKK